MTVQLPRLTNSLREPFDIDQAYLQRKSILQNHLLKSRNVGNSLNESELAKKIVDRWDEASTEVRQAYKQFIGAAVELIDGEVPSEEFQEVALTAYRLFGGPGPGEADNVDSDIHKKKLELQKLIGHAVSDAKLQRVAAQAWRLSSLQLSSHGAAVVSESRVNGSGNDQEFGADLVFQAPARFLVDVTLEDGELLSDESSGLSSSFHDDYDHNHSATADGKFNLSWLRNACDQIDLESTSQLSQDDLAMAICRVLDSDKPGEEIASALLDLVGDTAFETVQDLISDLQHFPCIKMKLKLQKRDTDGTKSLALNIKLEKTNSRQSMSRAFGPRFPKVKDEAWWLVLGNPSTSELYALKRISFSDRLATHMDLPSSSTSFQFQGMKLILVSDCYLGFEQEHCIEELIKSQETETII